MSQKPRIELPKTITWSVWVSIQVLNLARNVEGARLVADPAPAGQHDSEQDEDYHQVDAEYCEQSD